jgi:hypothetical protein
MTDTILASRIDALETNLARLQESVRLIENIPLDEGASQFKDKLSNVVETKVGRYRKKLRDVNGMLNPGDDPAEVPAEVLEQAWTEFLQVQDESRELFSSCLEFIGGVTFREKGGGHDPVWRVADALNSALAKKVLGENYYYLTVPALEEALRESEVRTIRFRFPEWTIWNLPLLAFEFGHVAIGGLPEMRELMNTEAQQLFEEDPENKKRLELMEPPYVTPLRRSLRRSCVKRVRVLLADAIATYTMGPAYAYAAIYLHFDPTEILPTREPTWRERVRVVLGCLEAMHADWGIKLTPVIEGLQGHWDATSPGALVSQREKWQLEYLDQQLLPEFTESLDVLHTAARYTENSWLKAQMFSNKWIEQFGADAIDPKLDEPQCELRDILNAAWWCRMSGPWREKVEDAAIKDCLRSLEARQQRVPAAPHGGPGYPSGLRGNVGSA